MNPSNETHQQQILPNVHNPLQFTIVLPHSDTNSNPNSSLSNPSNVNDLLTLGIPRKRRRGRPHDTLSSNQVYNLPPEFPNNHQTTQNSFGSNHFDRNPNIGSDQAAQVGVSDEIIVINKEATSEALIALTAGFPADVLTEEEIDAGVVSVVGGIEQVNYILIRNHIITKWRENVFNWVTKEMFLDVVPSHCSKLLDSAYNYLLSHGYINFGVSPLIKDKILAEANTKGNVIVIGAGLSGLAAARQLMTFGYKVTVLEGRKRPGGRVYTRKMEGGNKVAAADLGGSVLTGTHGNPLGILARQLSYPLHKIRDKCPLYRLDGTPVDSKTDTKVEIAFNQLLDKASKLRQLMGEVSQDVSLGAALETFWEVDNNSSNSEETSLFNWHLANLEYANAGLLSKLSLAFWDQDDPYDMGGDHCFLPGGNWRLVQALAENIPILYEKTVNSIRYSSDGVQVAVNGGQVFEGDIALCTVPLGVLKSGFIKFTPALPQRKLDGIKRLGFGLLNKVAMLFPNPFWGTDLDMFGHLSENPSTRGEFFLFYSYANVAGGPVLMALVAGEAARSFESMPPTDAVKRILRILRGIYSPQGIEVPEPIQTVCTRWGCDPFSLGSYSNVAVGSTGDDYDILAESVGDGKLFFAGEATTRRYPATMHGAFLSGLREAANIYHFDTNRALRGKIEKNPSKNAARELERREQVLELREVKGGDEMRLNYLIEKLGVKLIGRKGLGPGADDVISQIKAERSKSKPAVTVKSGTLKPKSAMKQKLVRKAKILRKNNNQSLPVKGVGGNDVEVKVGGGSVSGMTKLVVSESIPSVNMNVGEGLIGNFSSSASASDPPNVEGLGVGVASRDWDLVELDGEML
ncbi:unnamed protein product [Lactuca saligna]|uniref:SWIRM domain-containing protein n=1 Tax=Lactuca saligna TaxID=75948 RepID=A0AA35ZR12_LACSI|nr:unnamed protein product [Lactuca saligna]